MENEIYLNVVTCGNCGDVFGHKLGITEATCPYCKYTDDISSFPDLRLVDPARDIHDSIVTLVL